MLAHIVTSDTWYNYQHTAIRLPSTLFQDNLDEDKIRMHTMLTSLTGCEINKTL